MSIVSRVVPSEERMVSVCTLKGSVKWRGTLVILVVGRVWVYVILKSLPLFFQTISATDKRGTFFLLWTLMLPFKMLPR